MEIENSEVLSPPPYPAPLPSYDEILQSSSPVQLQLDTELTRSNLQLSSQERSVNWHSYTTPSATTHFGSTLSLPAPPSYDDIMQFRVIEEQYCNSSIQQPEVMNEQQNETRVEMNESDRELQQRIERRMAAIDQEIRQRHLQRISSERNVSFRAGKQRVFNVIRRYNPVRVMDFLKKQKTVHQ